MLKQIGKKLTYTTFALNGSYARSKYLLTSMYEGRPESIARLRTKAM